MDADRLLEITREFEKEECALIVKDGNLVTIIVNVEKLVPKKMKKRIIIRTRKEKPPRSATKPMRVGSGGNPVGAAIVISFALFTLLLCIIGLLGSLE